MKVTIITREYPPHVYGGAGVHVRHLSRELSKIIDVDVRCFGNQLIPAGDGSRSPKAARCGELQVKGYQGWERMKQGKQKFASVLGHVTTDLSMLIDDIDSDVVHTHTWYTSLAGYLAKMLYHVPFVLSCHSLEPLRPWKENQLGRGYQMSAWLEKTGIEGADKVIAVSEMMKQDILRHFKVPEEKVEVIHNGIDVEKWKHTPLQDSLKKEYGIKDDYILFVGRPTPQKGMEYLVEARDLIEKDVQIVMGAVGADTKEYEREMERKVAGKKDIVWIRKRLKEEEYIQLFSGALVFVCPSIYEPFGIINLEAMACRTPVVASAVGGIVEVVVPGETGTLVEPAKPKHLAEEVNRLIRDRQMAKRFGENGRKRIEEHFSWAYIAQQTRRLYEHLVSFK